MKSTLNSLLETATPQHGYNPLAVSELSLQLGVTEATIVLVLSIFYEEYSAYPKLMTHYIEGQNWSALHACVHKLKGSSGSLQMHNLRALLAELEGRLKLGELVTVEQLQPVYDEIYAVINYLQLDRSNH